MKPGIRILIVVAALLPATELLATTFAPVNRIVREFAIDPAGSVWIDNPFGSIDVIGGEGTVISVTAERSIVATDSTALKEAADAVVISFQGDSKVRLIRTVMPALRNAHATVNYTIRVPKTVAVKIGSKSAEHIRVAHIGGSVTVNGFAGTVIMEDVSGASALNVVNGRVIYDYQQSPTAKAEVQAVNADIDVYVPPAAKFDWIADTINGDILTTFPIRGGRFAGTIFRGQVNGSGGPTINTATMMGRVLLLAKGSNPAQASSMRLNRPVHEHAAGDVLLHPSQKIQLPFVTGDWTFAASVADVTVGEVRGNAHVETGAGEVELGTVFGQCIVTSMGGPLNLGDIIGLLSAHTGAGDVLVRAARMGGEVSTDGGLIRIIYSGGPMTLRSGGGDIIVRQTSGAIDAQTTSGDITITGDPRQRTLKMLAHTMQGNVILNVSPRFGADIDATILTSDPDVNEMHIDFTGLTVRREQVGAKTRIHATGKINGGGERVELYAEEGDIHISSQSISPMRLANPKR
ncbi:MAG TPA: hypothetical protein VHX14_09410 [Thermoanaerobaculia bacterium]|jgi:DUF4097 and DUF4098 domain-containing protein YvlB|nr:hypothetical protein [Thermoanaerobaculia bacterium]